MIIHLKYLIIPFALILTGCVSNGVNKVEIVMPDITKMTSSEFRNLNIFNKDLTKFSSHMGRTDWVSQQWVACQKENWLGQEDYDHSCDSQMDNMYRKGIRDISQREQKVTQAKKKEERQIYLNSSEFLEINRQCKTILTKFAKYKKITFEEHLSISDQKDGDLFVCSGRFSWSDVYHRQHKHITVHYNGRNDTFRSYVN